MSKRSKMRMEKRDKLQKEKLSEEGLKKIRNVIDTDEFLKYHNISIVDWLMCDKGYCFIKVYFICGPYFLEGTIDEIIDDIRHILKENKVDIKIFCPSCSSKNLRFSGGFCLCNDCGSLSIPEDNRVVKQYKLEDKKFWWAKALVEMNNSMYL